MASVSEILDDEFSRLQADIIRRHEEAGQVATGKTKAAFAHYNPTPTHGILEGAVYAGALERGRGPARGKGSSNSDFLANLKEWIVAKGLKYKDEKDLERLAKFLKWYINKFGTKLFRSGKTKDILTTPVDEFTERLYARISDFFTTDIENEIFAK